MAWVRRTATLTLCLQILVNLAYVAQSGFPFKCGCPALYEPEGLVLYIIIQCGDLQNRDKVVDEFARGDLRQELITTVLDTYVRKLCVIIIKY